MKIITVCNEAGIVFTQFKLTERDANNLCDQFDTSWMTEEDEARYFSDERE